MAEFVELVKERLSPEHPGRRLEAPFRQTKDWQTLQHNTGSNYCRTYTPNCLLQIVLALIHFIDTERAELNLVDSLQCVEEHGILRECLTWPCQKIRF